MQFASVFTAFTSLWTFVTRPVVSYQLILVEHGCGILWVRSTPALLVPPPSNSSQSPSQDDSYRTDRSGVK